MKKIKYIIILLAFINCKAQIVNLDSDYEIQQGYYYKDINNVLNQFEGTYIYNDGNLLFEITLVKKTHLTNNGYYYEDALVGGYRIVENGVEKVNTLATLNNNYTSALQYTLYGNFINTGQFLCHECGANEKWILGSIEDPVSGSVDRIYIRKDNVFEDEKLKIWILHELRMGTSNNTGSSLPISYPIGEDLVLYKQ